MTSATPAEALGAPGLSRLAGRGAGQAGPRGASASPQELVDGRRAAPRGDRPAHRGAQPQLARSTAWRASTATCCAWASSSCKYRPDIPAQGDAQRGGGAGQDASAPRSPRAFVNGLLDRVAVALGRQGRDAHRRRTTSGLEALDALAGVDALCLFVGEDERPLQGIAGLRRLAAVRRRSRGCWSTGFFTGAAGDSCCFPPTGGSPPGAHLRRGAGHGATPWTPHGWAEALLGGGARCSTRPGVESVALEVPGAGRLDDAARAQGPAEAFLAALHGQRVAVLADKGVVRLLPPARAVRLSALPGGRVC